MRICVKCGTTDSKLWYAGPTCRKCYMKAYNINYRLRRKELDSVRHDQIQQNNKEYYAAHRKEIQIRQAEYNKTHREHIIAHHREYNRAHAEQISQYQKEHRKSINDHTRNRMKTDIQFRLASNLRKRLVCAITSHQKTGSAIRDLGCTIEQLKDYLESKFQPDMTWGNYGKGPGTWQIDHIIALCKFDLTNREQFLMACHYTNLQPLWHKDHIQKTCKEIHR